MSDSATLWTVSCQAPLSMGFSRQEYWSGLLCPPPEDLPYSGIKLASPVSPVLQADSSPLSHQGSPDLWITKREGNGTPLQHSCLENPMDRGAWWAAVHEVAKSRIRLSNFTFTFHFHVLEKEMATHSSVLASRIPGTGEPVGFCLLGRTESDMTEAT